MKRLFMIPLALTLSLGAVAAAWSADRVVVANYPPLMMTQATGQRGYAVDVLEEAARRAGRSFELNDLPFERAIHVLQTESATLMPALFQGKARDDLFRWVVEIGTAPLVFAAKGRTVRSLDEARALDRIVVEAGTSGDVLLTTLEFTNVTRVQSPNQSAQMLAAGRVDSWFLTELIMQHVWDTLELPGDLSFGAAVQEVPIFLVASPTLPDDTAKAYHDAVEAMRADGTLDKILARYLRPRG